MSSEDDLPKLAAPAHQALSGAGITCLEQRSELSAADVEKLHGMGPTALAALRGALADRGLSFRT